MSNEINNIEGKCSMGQTQSENAVQEVLLGDEMAVEMYDQMNPAVMYDLQKYYPKAYKILDTHKKGFMYREVMQNLQRGIQEGLYRPTIDTDIVTKTRLVAMMMPFDHELFPTSKYSVPAVMHELTNFFLHGITNAKGQKMIEKYKLTEKAKHV
eukprot:gnl/Hemi2/16566_TR5552_c0_g1_i1.p1 gnl/Hemi2/16566_TR5552_c0_g1~~gnl/Hemi2/16566_TR5552_c0_g1_i1.p1  ORF type:complete len:165 (+),score=14.10 gnl/Hemi2/16566_TR5552_c0_g1_i1:35-496(+)